MKIKIKVTMERDFEPMLEFYNNKNALAILEQEIRSYKSDPAFMLDYKDTKITVEGELLES